MSADASWHEYATHKRLCFSPRTLPSDSERLGLRTACLALYCWESMLPVAQWFSVRGRCGPCIDNWVARSGKEYGKCSIGSATRLQRPRLSLCRSRINTERKNRLVYNCPEFAKSQHFNLVQYKQREHWRRQSRRAGDRWKETNKSRICRWHNTCQYTRKGKENL